MGEGEHVSTLVFFVNGKKITDNNVDPEWTLLYYLRHKLRLCGTKLGCGEGGCGACTVMVSKFNRIKNKVVHYPVNACLAPVCSMHGLSVVTVEGIGSTKTKLHPVQERIAKFHGSQCGFCTPGFVMSMYCLLRNNDKPSTKDLETTFQGNLCRCTGYRPIIEGYKTFTCAMGEKCCKNGGFQPSNNLQPYDPTQEPIFPPELKLSDKYDRQFLAIKKDVAWYRPLTLPHLLDLKTRFPEAKLVVGNTEIGVETKLKNMFYPTLIQPTLVPELTQIRYAKTGVRVGAAVTLNDLEEYLKNEIANLPETKTRVFQNIVEILQVFAGQQIRSVGSLGGNIMTGSPISDLIPILMANKAVLEVHSSKGSRKVDFDNDFFVGYRRNVIKAEEILLAVEVPYSSEGQYCEAYKQSRRREDDIAIVNLAVRVTLSYDHVIEDIRAAFGGMSYKPLLVKSFENLKGLKWNKETLEKAYEFLLKDLPLENDAPGGMVSYRKSLSLSLFFKAFLSISSQLQEINTRDSSAIRDFKNEEYKSSQYFTTPRKGVKVNSVHLPIVHNSAFKQATGEAIYCDDLPFLENETYLCFVISEKAHARISIDASEALEMENVHRFISAADFSPESNIWGFANDEKYFYSDVVTSQGQIIGGIVASNALTARKAAKKVKVVYEELQPVIVSIEDAIRHESFFHNPFAVMERGDVGETFEGAPHVIEGEVRTGGQEHFYLETQSCVVVPKQEDNEIEIICASQEPYEVTRAAAKALGLPENKVVTKVKRLGGGFGGKESRATLTAVICALAASKINRPVRLMLDRDEDIAITGGRHPSLAKYKIAFTNTGRILAIDVKLYVNCGYAVDFSDLVLERAMVRLENAYDLPAFRITGYTCKTNLPSNTAFRGFGGPQATFVIESIMQQVAFYLHKDLVEVSEVNLCKENDLTICGQELTENNTLRCWQECMQNSDYYERRKVVEKFNRENRYKKMGLCVTPLKFGVGYVPYFLNQGGALVLVYTDGSVLLSHGGVEMGQGLHTKMMQVASQVLEIPMERIHVSETSTDKIPNTTPTAASCGSDINGAAVLHACQIIKDRLKPYRDSFPNLSWEEWVKKAYFDRVNLAAVGFYDAPTFLFNSQKISSGDHRVHRVDIVMDLGESLNPAIDIGQIEGGFMQGYGLFVMEEMVYSPRGAILTKGPGTYKIPSLGDIPREFNVSLLKGSSNSRAVYSSKAVGEPPLLLGCSVALAITDAIKAARLENGINANFQINAPVTAEKIRMACEDSITVKFKEGNPGSFKPWNVVP